MLRVSAHDKGTGKSESITIKNDKGRLSEADIERMIKEAEAMADEDNRVKEQIEAKNQFENYIYGLKNQVTDENQLGGKLAEDDKKTILDALKAKSTWLDSNGSTATKEDIEEQKAELEAIVNPITSKLYDGGAPGGDAGGEPTDHDGTLFDSIHFNAIEL